MGPYPPLKKLGEVAIRYSGGLGVWAVGPVGEMRINHSNKVNTGLTGVLTVVAFLDP